MAVGRSHKLFSGKEATQNKKQVVLSVKDFWMIQDMASGAYIDQWSYGHKLNLLSPGREPECKIVAVTWLLFTPRTLGAQLLGLGGNVYSPVPTSVNQAPDVC